MPVTPDLSWGRVVCHYVVASHPHTFSFHIGALAAGPYAYPYPFAVPSATTDLENFFQTNIKFIWHDLYQAAVAIDGYDVYKNNGVGPETFLFADAPNVPILGTSVVAPNLASQVTYNYRSANGDPAKFIFLDANKTDQTKEGFGGLNGNEHNFIGAITSDLNAVSHDGTHVQSFRDRTMTYNRKLRRKYGYA